MDLQLAVQIQQWQRPLDSCATCPEAHQKCLSAKQPASLWAALPCFRTMAKSPAFLRFAVRLGSSVPQSLKPRAPDEHKRGGDLMRSNGMWQMGLMGFHCCWFRARRGIQLRCECPAIWLRFRGSMETLEILWNELVQQQMVAVSCCGISPVASCSIVHCLPISQVGTIPKSSQIDSRCHFCFPPVFHSLDSVLPPQAGGQQWTCGQGGTTFVAQRSSVR